MSEPAKYRCPHCQRSILSPRAIAELAYAAEHAPKRGGYIWESARIAYDAGKSIDPTLVELLNVGALVPHLDKTKGWVVAW